MRIRRHTVKSCPLSLKGYAHAIGNYPSPPESADLFDAPVNLDFLDKGWYDNDCIRKLSTYF
jgi:hypothetical protein